MINNTYWKQIYTFSRQKRGLDGQKNALGKNLQEDDGDKDETENGLIHISP